jgi:hypothetical protein
VVIGIDDFGLRSGICIRACDGKGSYGIELFDKYVQRRGGVVVRGPEGLTVMWIGAAMKTLLLTLVY